MLLNQALNIGKKELLKKNIKSNSIDSELLLSYVLKKERSDILLSQDDFKIDKFQYNKFLDLIEHRKKKSL